MYQPDSKRLGMLTPSSNTVLEPLTSAMLHELPEVSAHFARFRVVKISLENDALNQFNSKPMLDASAMLADAKVDVICWNGTSSGWMGFDTDLHLCKKIEQHSGVLACTSVLALNEILAITGKSRIAFVTPYLDEIQQAIITNYSNAGFNIVAEEHLQDAGNYSFATYSEQQILDLCRKVGGFKPEAICVFCTNFRGAGIASIVEEEMGIPVYDTVATGLWKSLRLAGVDPSNVKGWGSIFDIA